MPEFQWLRPKPQPEGRRPLVVYLHNGTLLPAEGKRCTVDAHVRMLLRDGDVETYPDPDAAPAPEPTKSSRRVREEESR